MTLNRLKPKVSVKRKKIPIIHVHFIRFKENTSSVLIRACVPTTVNMVFIATFTAELYTCTCTHAFTIEDT